MDERHKVGKGGKVGTIIAFISALPLPFFSPPSLFPLRSSDSLRTAQPLPPSWLGPPPSTDTLFLLAQLHAIQQQQQRVQAQLQLLAAAPSSAAAAATVPPPLAGPLAGHSSPATGLSPLPAIAPALGLPPISSLPPLPTVPLASPSLAALGLLPLQPLQPSLSGSWPLGLPMTTQTVMPPQTPVTAAPSFAGASSAGVPPASAVAVPATHLPIAPSEPAVTALESPRSPLTTMLIAPLSSAPTTLPGPIDSAGTTSRTLVRQTAAPEPEPEPLQIRRAQPQFSPAPPAKMVSGGAQPAGGASPPTVALTSPNVPMVVLPNLLEGAPLVVQVRGSLCRPLPVMVVFERSGNSREYRRGEVVHSIIAGMWALAAGEREKGGGGEGIGAESLLPSTPFLAPSALSLACYGPHHAYHRLDNRSTASCFRERSPRLRLHLSGVGCCCPTGGSSGSRHCAATQQLRPSPRRLHATGRRN